ncbi:unnamed protein product, partial [Adineta steineri]
MYSTQG